MGATEDWLASIGNATGAKTALVLSADPRSPDELAGHAKIGAQLGLPPIVIGSDPEAFKARAAEKSIADAVKDAPKTAAWLQDRDNGGIAKDDVANLSWFEKGLNDWAASGDTGVSRAIVRGTKSLAGSMQGFGAIQSAITAADIGLTKEQIIAREVAALGPNPDVSMVAAAQQAALIKYDAVSGMTEQEKAAMLQGASARLQAARDALAKAAAIPRSGIAQEGADTWAAAPNTLMGKLGTIAENPAAVLAFLGETAAESLPALIPATVATIATRSPAIGAGVMGATSGYLTTSSEAMGFLENRGIKMETPEDVMAVLSNQELMLEARQYGLDKGLIVGAMDTLSGGVAGKTLMKSPVGEAITQSVAQALFGGGGEALAELAVDGKLDWGAVLIEGLAEFVTAPAQMVSVGRGWLKSSAEKAARADTTAGKIEAIDKMAAESKVKARSPEKMADLLDRVMDGKSLYVPADDLNELFQAKEFGPADWGIDPATFEEMLASGGDVAIPAATYASKITGTENADWFKQNAKTSVGEMSAAEATRFNEEVRGIIEEQMAQADADRQSMQELRASDVQVKDQLYTMLREAGHTKDVADTNARVVAAAIRTMAQRSGQDPLDMAKRFGLEVKGPQTNEMRRRGNLDIALNTLRKGAVQKPGASLTDFVIGKGGLQDTGGDLAAMDAPKGVIAETRDEVMARTSQPSLMGLPSIGKGKGLDDMARAAVEAGYFPDLQGKPEDNLVNVLMDALRAEMAGQKRFIPGQEGNADLQGLAAELDRRGIDLALSNDEIAAKLQEADGQQYDQSGQLRTDTEAFRKWFGDSKVVDADGKPLVVYHGTGKDFEAFDPSRSGSSIDSGFLGAGIYMTNRPRIADYYAEVAAKYGAGQNLMPLYVSLQNPFMWGVKTFGVRDLVNLGTPLPTEVHQAVIDRTGFKFDPDQEPDYTWERTLSAALTDVLKERGYDGVIASTNDGAAVGEIVAFSPTQIKSVFNRGTWDANDPRILFQQNRASIIFPAGGVDNGQSVINMFENSDLSSFQHEIGHYMLEVFNVLAGEDSAPQDMRDDMAAIQKYLGMEPGAKPTVEQHELFARTWEAYLMEGKSPTLELADAFARFKAWMVRIYQTVAGLKVKINPEIRAVMDRMIATDEEIRAARAEQAMKPLFTDETAAGMTPGAFQTYQRMARRATEQAEQSLLEKTMAVERRKMESWWRAEYKQVLGQVTKSMNSQRPYRLTEMLANQTWLSDTPKAVPDMQIDRKQLVDMFGAGVLAELSREKLGGKRAIYKDGGASPMEVADLFGFANPQEMVDILQNAGKRKDAIRAETDRIMRDRYGDPLTDGSIEGAALEAIHSEQQAMTVASEVRHLAGRAGVSTRNLTAQVFRQRARLMLGRLTVSEAGNPNAFLAAGRKAAKRAEDAFARVASGKDSQDALIAATRHKEQQLLNHYLYLESRDFARELDSGREKMRGYTKASVRAKLEGGYIEQIDTLLDAYDFRVQSKKQVARAESLTAFVQRMTDAGRAGELAIDQRVIDRAKKVHYSRLSVDELRGLFDTIANIDHLGRFKQKLIDARRRRDLDASVKVVTDAAFNIYGTGKNADKNYVRNTFNLLLTMDTMLMEYDGMKEMGAVYDEVKRDIDMAGSVEQKMQIELTEKVDSLFGVYSAKEIAAMQKPKVIQGGNGRPWAKVEILSVALNMGNENNRQRMFDKSVHPSNRLTPDQATALVATLDARDWAFVKSYAELINSYWPELVEVSERRTGTKPKKVDAAPFDTPVGQMPGWYYPIIYDPALSARAATDESSAWDSFLATGWGARAEVNSGMTKERAATGGGRALNFDLAEGIGHMKKTIRLIALSEAVDNSFRILNDKRVVQAMQDAGRQGDLNVWNLWLKDVAQGLVVHTDTLSIMSRNLKNNFTLSRLAFNMRTVVMQATGLAHSAAVIGKKNLFFGLTDYLKRPRELSAEVIAKSAFMAERQSTMNKDIHDYANDVRLTGPMASRYGKFKGGIGKWGFAPFSLMQFYSVDMPTWLGAYRSGLEQFNDDAKAMHYADRMVERSQGGGVMADRTAFARGTVNKGTQQSEFIRLFSTLGGYMITKMNRGYIEVKRAKVQMSEAETVTESVLAATNAATNLFLIYVAEAAAMAVIYAMIYGLDDDDKDPEDYAKFIAAQTAGAVVGGVPFGKDAATAFQGYGAGGVLGSVLEMPANFYAQAVQGENDKALRRSAVDLVGTITGFPSVATMRVIEGALAEKGPSMAEMFFGQDPIGR